MIAREFRVTEKIYQEIENRFSHLAEYWRGMAEVSIDQNNLAQAAQRLEQALEISPYDPELADRAAAVYNEIERHQDAQKTLRRALKASPSSTDLLISLEKYGKAKSIVSKYRLVEARDATLMVPATLAALYQHDLSGRVAERAEPGWAIGFSD